MEKWSYSSDRKYRTRMSDGRMVIQKRVVYPENSKHRLVKKAQAGLYGLHDLKITGAGNSYLIIGWEQTDSIVAELNAHLLTL